MAWSGLEWGSLACAALAAVLASFFRAFALSGRLVQSSDSAQDFVVAHAVARGNLLLSGWHFPLNNYYFTDTIPYAVLERMLGAQPFLLALEPALIYALFVAVALIVCLPRSQPFSQKIEAVAILALVFAAPVWIGSWNPLFLSAMHVASAVGAFVALGLCARLPEIQTKVASLLCMAAIVVLTAAVVASDPFALVFAFAPALAVLASDAISSRRLIGAFAAMAFGVTIGWLLPHAIALVGGFTIEIDVVGRFVAAPLLVRNLVALLAGVLRVFGILIPESPLTPGSVALLALRCTVFAAAIAAVVRTLRKMIGTGRTPLLDRLLCAGILTVLPACAASAQFGKGIVAHDLWGGGPPMRYLMPVYLFAAVLTARQIPDMLAFWPARARHIASCALLLLAALNLVAGGRLSGVEAQPRWIADNQADTAARWLERHGLSQGIGEYWSANLVTALSGDRVQVRSVVQDKGRLIPYIWVEDARWYTRAPQFVLWQEPNKTGVTAAAVRATYPVCGITLVAGFRVALLAQPSHACRRIRPGAGR
ncbi:MAG TPA: hypothetical protein VGL35_07410 [Rhizomicrobium sp.]